MNQTVRLATLFFLCITPVMAANRDSQWKAVEDAIQKGLPKTAITNLEPIIQAALKEKAYAEAAKAIGRKIALEGNIEGNKPEEKITRLEAEIARAPKEMAPVLHTILAHWYWHYFQQNRWRFMQRTTTAEPPGKDFTTWDLPRLFAEIDKQFQKALAAENFLKATPVGDWDALLVKGTMPDSHRPTLYDFIAWEALDFYTSGEQAATKAQGAFELSAESPILGTTAEFLAWKLPAETTPVVRAIGLYQNLLRFHQNDPAPRLAFAAADLDRLTWGWNAAFGEDKNARYKAALDRFISEHADFDITALAFERKARVLQQEGDLVEARKVALRGAGLFPDSPGAKLCRNVVAEIEAKSATLTTERVWNAPWPKLTVRYRNLTNVHFRAIPCDWEVFLQKRHNRPENLNHDERKEVLAKTPAFEWSETLPPTLDFKERTFAATVPAHLKPGFYFIAASHDPKFGENDNVVSLADVWVSDLSLVTRERAGQLEGFVLQARSGEPVAGAQVAVWHLDNNGSRVADPVLTTDQDGFFSMRTARNRGYLFLARHQDQALASATDLWGSGRGPEPPQPRAQTVFFTDRALYRPGQTIHYKGICLWVDPAKDNYETLKREALTVVFQDVNGKEIARQKHQANDYGSFSGSFTAPRDRVLGQMAITVVAGRAVGSTHFRVEEYKRPKFEVVLEPPKTAPKLNEKVRVIGRATSYTGAAVDGASVSYRVVREVRMPWWWGWWRGGFRGGDSQEIAHGRVTTGTDGSFTIEFLAKPDPKVPEKDEPTFVYSITADVTDGAGETRSDSRSVRVGYTALEATLSADAWQVQDKAVVLNISTRTLDGEPQVAEGSVKVHELMAPPAVQRLPIGGEDENLDGRPDDDQSDANKWPLGKVVAEKGFTTSTNGTAELAFTLKAGAYRAVLETQDRFGKKVTGLLQLNVLNPDAPALNIRIAHLLAAPRWDNLQPGDQFMALWGTGYDHGRAFVEIEHQHKMLKRFWTQPGRTQQQITLAVTEALRGGFTLHVTQVRENRGYLVSRRVEVPWRNKELEVKWEHFVSKLQPGQKETWTAVITPRLAPAPNAPEKLAAEMVATLYDASLDAFAAHSWPRQFQVFRADHSTANSQYANLPKGFQHSFGNWVRPYESVVITYRSFPPDLTQNLWRYGWFNRRAGVPMRRGVDAYYADNLMAAETAAVPMATPPPASAALALGDTPVLGKALASPAADKLTPLGGAARKSEAPAGPKPDLSQVTARKNLNETAFFFPQLTTDSNGVVRMIFTMPEALTRWRFMGFAHDRLLRSGFLQGEAVTSKDLMVQPNPPRFLREGDLVEFTVKVSNQSDKPQSGRVRLTFNDALAAQSADKLLGNTRTEQTFTIPPRESRSFSWRIAVPDGCGFLTYKAVAATDTLSDGEEGAVPVLSRRILVRESLPLPIRGPATRKFEFARLLKSGGSRTLQHQSLTVQMVSNPAWYAVLALPYLMEYPYECSEQVFNRYYANSLARTLANSDPKIARVFEQWRNTPALDSPLEKNQDLKSVMLEETPWLRDAQNESQARRNVGILFDANRLDSEMSRTLQKLTEMQLADGAWPWFPGGPGNDYITLYITTGFGRLRHLKADVSVEPALRSLNRLDGWMHEHYQRIQRWSEPDKYVPSSTDALYLYGRSFFLDDQPVNPQHKPALEFFLAQARKHWLQTNSRQTQGHLVLALHRFAKARGTPDPTPMAIMASLKERSVSNEEMGRFWRDLELSWWWYHAPIETQALMIEAFDEVAQDPQAVEDCRVWLLKQKQTQDWKTTKATADAVYALLLRGRDLLSSDALVELKLGGIDLTPGKRRPTKAGAAAPPVEAGTGFYEVRFPGPEVKPKMGEIMVRKADPGVAWGSVHWQYLEEMTKVTPYAGTPLKLRKTLYVKTNTDRGPVIEPVRGPLRVGDELVVRLELRTDRDMEYVHLKDQRGSGTEPVNVLSRYRYQDGLAYYESTRDTASHFFIDYLPKGVYVFEYSTRVQLRGEYQTGVAEIQCLYAPEFNSHSESLPLTVR